MAINLFISYAHEDVQHKDEFIKHLSGLQRSGLLQSWDDRQITVGQEWDKAIKRALEQAKIVVFLVSADFMASDYIHDVEIKNAIERYKLGAQKIVPVLIRPCDFTSLEALSHFQFLPTEARAVTSWDNIDEAWLNIIQGIKKLITDSADTTPAESEQTTEQPKNKSPQNQATHADKQPLGKTKFNTHHQYTANRIQQDGDFIKYIYQQKATNEKLHFFFLHGGDLQEHKGLYKRFVHKLAGRGADFKEGYKAADIIVKDFDAIRFPGYTEAETLKIGIASALMDSLNIPERDMTKVLNKNLAFALTASPDLKDLSNQDKVCFLLSISETNWQPNLTPAITRWFITHFCQKNLPAEMPHFYFFFSVEYDEDNEEIKEQLDTVLDQAQFTVALPELDMVTKKDVRAWFDKYEKFWPRKRMAKKTMKKYFDKEDEEMYMEDVQFLLLKIINEINNAEKYDA